MQFWFRIINLTSPGKTRICCSALSTPPASAPDVLLVSVLLSYTQSRYCPGAKRYLPARFPATSHFYRCGLKVFLSPCSTIWTVPWWLQISFASAVFSLRESDLFKLLPVSRSNTNHCTLRFWLSPNISPVYFPNNVVKTCPWFNTFHFVPAFVHIPVLRN
jgi:hypothetical protein